MFLLLTYATVALGMSFLCSMLEATLLSIPASHIAMLVERGSRTGQQLQAMKANIDRPLSAILTLNTIAHTAGAVGVGAEAAALFGNAAVGIASAVMTLLILVVSEIIPKTLGAAYAKSLSGFTAVTTRLMIYSTFPIIVVLQYISRLVGGRPPEDTLSRGEFLAVTHLGHEAGSLNEREYRTIRNLMSLGGLKVHDIMTPRTVLEALPEERTIGEVMQEPQALRYSRIPVYRDSLDRITGYVTRYDLMQALRTDQRDKAIGALSRDIEAVPEQASVSTAMETMLKNREHILVVVDEYGGVEGIVTLEDAIETLLGLEIIDETDTTADLQSLARDLARKRRDERIGSP
jgi:CBS domain containing-hemolysin-like protein